MKKPKMKYIFSAVICAAILSVCFLQSDSTAIKLDENAVNVSNSKSKHVVLGGQTFGIKLFTDGVMIIKTEDVKTQNSVYSPSKNAGLRVNDVITHINDKKVFSNEQLGEAVKSCMGNAVKLKVKRENETFDTSITPIKDAGGVYRIGIWVRDSSAGIGTVTFYDTDNGYFATLGHGICDSDTDKLLPLSHGEAVKANITSVTKSAKGTPGGLNGYFIDEEIGKIICNSNCGMFGEIENPQNLKNRNLIELAKGNEVKTGDAYIYSTVDEGGVKKYSVRIEAVSSYNCKSTTKNMIVRITDKSLLEKTGGIVQGMSGSPIVQNGKLIGAVTHVFLNKPDTGYGIFAENMSKYFADYSSNMSGIAA